ncbi:MAG: tetratricopeptide repeat protein [bacterium]
MTDQRAVDDGWFDDDFGRDEGEGDARATALAERDPERYERLQSALALYQREISASVDPRRRAALCYEVGRIYERELGDDRAAIHHYQRAYTADPTHVPTLRAVRRVFGRVGRWSMVLKLIDAEIRVRPAPAERARMLREKGEIYLARFDRPEAARICYLQALDFVRDDAAAARGLTAAAALAGDRRAFAAAAERAAHAADGDLIGAAMAIEAADAWRVLGAHDATRRLLEGVLEGRPDDPLALLRLADLARRTGDDRGYIDLADGLCSAIDDPARRAARRAALAKLAAQRVETAGRAVPLLVAALTDAPDRLGDLLRLAAVLQGAGRWSEAASALSRAADARVSVDDRVDLLWRLADIHDRQDEGDAAVAALRRLLELDPAHGPALRRLCRLSMARGEVSAVEAALARAVDATDEPDRAAALGLALAERRVAIGDRDGALDALEAAQRQRPDSPAIADALAALGVGAGDADAGPLDGDPAAWLRDAEAVEVYVGEVALARRLAERAAGAGPSVADAARALLDQLGDRSAAARAARTERRIAAASAVAVAVRLWVRLGELRRDALGDLEGAASAYEAALELDPDHLPALRALRALPHVEDDPEREAELLVAERDRVDDVAARSMLLYRLGHLYAGPLGRPDLAAEAWESAVADDPDALGAATGLVRLYEAGGHHAALIALHRRLAERAALPAEAVAHLLAIARLSADALDDPAGAVDALEAARAADPRRAEPLLALERLRLARREFDALAEVYEDLAELATTPTLRADFRLTRARLAEAVLDDLRTAFEGYQSVLAEQPEHPEALEWMEGWADEAGDLTLLAEILERRFARADDPTERSMILLRAGRVLRAARQLREAARCYEAVLDIDRRSPIALRALREIYEDLGDRDKAIAATEMEGRAALDPANASALFVEAGRTREIDQSAGAEALADYLAALARNPADEDAAAAVRRICERTGRWRALADALERQAGGLPERRRALLEEAIRLHTDRLAQPREAIRILRALIPDAEPDEVPALLQRLADLFVEREDWPAAVATYERLRAISPDPALRRAVTFRLIAIERDKAGAPDRARRWLGVMLEGDPSDVGALERLADLEAAVGDARAARIALARAVNAAEPGPQRAGLRRRIARMDLEQGRVDAAIAGLEAAAADTPDDPLVLEALADACLDAGRPARARAALQSALAVARPEGAVAERLRNRVAEAALAEGTDPADLIANLRTAVGERPDDQALRALFADALGRRDDLTGEAIDQLRWLLARAPLDEAHLTALRRQLERDGRADAAAEIARLRIAAGLGDADDARLSAAAPGVRPLQQPLDAAARGRLWSAVDPDFVTHLATLASAVPGAFGPKPPARPADAALVADATHLDRLLGGDGLVLALAPVPVDVVQRVDDRLVVSERLVTLAPDERAFFLAAAIDAGRRGVDVVTRWSPDDLHRRVIALALAADRLIKTDPGPRIARQAERLAARYGGTLARPACAAALRALLSALAQIPAAAAATLAATHRTGLLAAGGIEPAARALSHTVHGRESAAFVELARWVTGADYETLRAALGP